MRALRVEWRVEPSSEQPFLQPRRGAAVIAGDKHAGWLGELHPSVTRSGTSTASPASSSTSASWRAPPPGCRATRT